VPAPGPPAGAVKAALDKSWGRIGDVQRLSRLACQTAATEDIIAKSIPLLFILVGGNNRIAARVYSFIEEAS
jgi:hypothetical protein